MSSERDSAGAPAGVEAPAEIPERWSSQRKADLVLRLLRGEALDAVAVTAKCRPTNWRNGVGCFSTGARRG